MKEDNLIGKIAKTFSQNILNEIGEDNMQKLADTSQENLHEETCESHDYCDANMCMLEAVTEHTGLDSIPTDFMPVANRAWTMARENNFYQI